MGADYLEWLKAGARATGVDCLLASLERARRRCELAGYQPDLRVADAERLPFSRSNLRRGVLLWCDASQSGHVRSVCGKRWRVLKPGGQVRIMLYHHPSLTGAMLWLRYGWTARQVAAEAVYEHLESPGTKTYTPAEVRVDDGGLRGCGHPTSVQPGRSAAPPGLPARFQSPLYRMVWKLYPRAVARRLGRKWGLFLLISARKPEPTK